MASYSLGDLVNKTIVAKGDVKLYRLPLDSASSTYTVKAGQTVGVVYSYLLPGSGRSYVYLMFYDANGKAYYMRWGSAIDKGSLEEQGLLSDKEKAEAAAEANKSNFDKALSSVEKIALGVAAIFVIKSMIEKHGVKS